MLEVEDMMTLEVAQKSNFNRKEFSNILEGFIKMQVAAKLEPAQL